MTRSVAILASDAQAENQAKHVAVKLAALGFDVRRVSEKKRDRKQAAAVERAQKLVVIWSRAARGTPALRAAARRAHETGKLVSVSVGAAPPPVSGRSIAPPRQSAAWRGVLTTTRPLPDRPTPLARNPLAASRKSKKPERTRVAATVRAASAPTSAPTPAPRAPAKQRNVGRVLAVLSLISLGACVEVYAAGGSFAANIDSLLQAAQASVSDFLASLSLTARG